MTKLSVLALSGAVIAEERFYVDVEYLDRRAIHAFRDFLDRELFCEGTIYLAFHYKIIVENYRSELKSL